MRRVHHGPSIIHTNILLFLTHKDSAPSREALAIAADFHRLEVRFSNFIRFSLYPCLHSTFKCKKKKDCFAVIAQQNILNRRLSAIET